VRVLTLVQYAPPSIASWPPTDKVLAEDKSCLTSWLDTIPTTVRNTTRTWAIYGRVVERLNPVFMTLYCTGQH
jgi:hypothetical protein